MVNAAGGGATHVKWEVVAVKVAHAEVWGPGAIPGVHLSIVEYWDVRVVSEATQRTVGDWKALRKKGLLVMLYAGTNTHSRAHKHI